MSWRTRLADNNGRGKNGRRKGTTMDSVITLLAVGSTIYIVASLVSYFVSVSKGHEPRYWAGVGTWLGLGLFIYFVIKGTLFSWIPGTWGTREDGEFTSIKEVFSAVIGGILALVAICVWIPKLFEHATKIPATTDSASGFKRNPNAPTATCSSTPEMTPAAPTLSGQTNATHTGSSYCDEMEVERKESAIYQAQIRQYCMEHKIAIPAGFGRHSTGRYAVIRTDMTPPKLVAATWFEPEDVVSYIQQSAVRQIGQASAMALIILDCKAKRRLHFDGSSSLALGCCLGSDAG